MDHHTKRISLKNPGLSEDQLQSEQFILARQRKGVYRFRVEQVEFQCRLTEVKNKEYLTVCHIKPWQYCTNEEKLDGNNGFLMCPHIGYLFEKGLISFADNGEVAISKYLDPEILGAWNLCKRNIGAFNPEQIKYLSYHRNLIFRE